LAVFLSFWRPPSETIPRQSLDDLKSSGGDSSGGAVTECWRTIWVSGK
jgi:hypothetical protein